VVTDAVYLVDDRVYADGAWTVATHLDNDKIPG